MFLGRYEHTMDDKGRVSIPARYRALLAEEGAYITLGLDKNLVVMSTSAFERVYQKVNQLSFTDQSTRQFQRLFMASADRVEFDKAGRILIPAFLRESTGLQGTVMVVGMGGYFEIWAPADWQKQQAILLDPEANAQRYSAMDISVS
jgi:MraZ protein